MGICLLDGKHDLQSDSFVYALDRYIVWLNTLTNYYQVLNNMI
jgi:hypothetical protein